MHSADDNDCIDMDTYINDLFYSCETLLDKTDTEISLRLWNTKNEPFLFGERNCTIKRHLYVNVQSPFEWPELNGSYYNERGFCQGIRTHIAILSDGTVVPAVLTATALWLLAIYLILRFLIYLKAIKARHLFRASMTNMQLNRYAGIAVSRKGFHTKYNNTA